MKRFLLFVLVISLALLAGCNKVGDALEIETETMTATDEMTDEYIIERFYAAEDFWSKWVYGQYYRAYDDPSQFAFGSSRESVTSESPIQTSDELKAEMEKHFSKELVEMYWKQLIPEDKDGKLYIYTGDVGWDGTELESVTVKKTNDKKYTLTLKRNIYDGDDVCEVIYQDVYYISEDGNWVFENDKEDEYFYSWGEPERYNRSEFAPYNEILKKYYHTSRVVQNVDLIEKYGLVDIMLGFEEPLKSVGYCLMDINGDEVNELLIGKVNAGDKIVWDMYSVKDGEAYRVLVSGERNRHYICKSDEGYIIANEIHTNAMNYSYSYYADLDESVVKERLWLDWDKWCHSADYLDVTSQTVNEEKVNEITEKCRAKYITPDFIPFETLG